MIRRVCSAFGVRPKVVMYAATAGCVAADALSASLRGANGVGGNDALRDVRRASARLSGADGHRRNGVEIGCRSLGRLCAVGVGVCPIRVGASPGREDDDHELRRVDFLPGCGGHEHGMADPVPAVAAGGIVVRGGERIQHVAVKGAWCVRGQLPHSEGVLAELAAPNPSGVCCKECGGRCRWRGLDQVLKKRRVCVRALALTHTLT